MKDPIKIGHRGAMGYETENTMASFNKALALGVPMIELDVFKIASGELVVFHDEQLERLTNGQGLIAACTWETLKGLKVKGGHKIPLLSQVLRELAGKVQLNIELKGPQTAQPVAALLNEYFLDNKWEQKNLLISSFDWELLKETRAALPNIPIAVLTEANPLAALPMAKELGAVAVNPNYKNLDKEIVTQIHQAGFKVFPWTVNTPKDLKQMKTFGVDGVFTNYPDRSF